MLRSSERRLRCLSVKQGLVVTEVRCGCSASVVAVVGAVGRGDDESGVNAAGEKDVEYCASVFWVAAGVSCAIGRSMCWRAAV